MNKSLNLFKDLFLKLLAYKFIIINLLTNYFVNSRLTDVAKLVDALDLGPSNFCFESSSLSIRNFLFIIKVNL
jgi:hypothetical protein